MKEIERKNQRGFSLIEVVVSIGIFVLILGGIILFGVRSIEAQALSKAMQSSLENSRFAIESLSKRIRTSHEISPDNFSSGSNSLFIIDNVDDSKHCYWFNGGELLVASIYYSEDVADEYNAIDACNDFLSTDFDSLVGSSKVSVSGRFYVKATDLTEGKRGLVRIIINLAFNEGAVNPSEKDEIILQSAVSLKDYGDYDSP